MNILQTNKISFCLLRFVRSLVSLVMNNIANRDIISLVISYSSHPNEYLLRLLVCKLWYAIGSALNDEIKSRFIVQRCNSMTGYSTFVETYSVILPSGKKHGEYKCESECSDKQMMLREHHFYKNGTKCGPSKYYDHYGRLSLECYYEKDKLNGEHKQYVAGNLHCHSNYVNNKFDGKRVVYKFDGKPKAECYYKNNVLHGPFANYDEDGKVRAEGEYVNGHKHGKFRGWVRGFRIN